MKKRIKYNIDIPELRHSRIALNISISADISNDRIKGVMGEACDIIKVKCINSSTDVSN